MINNKYALNPETKINGLELYQVLSRFGLSEGRFITGLPENWKKMILDIFTSRDLGDIDIQRVSRALVLLKERGGFLRQTFDYEQTQPWIDNALRAKENGMIENIIGNTSDPGISAKDILESSLLEDCRDTKILWSADDMVRVAMPLLSMSEEFYIVDDHIQFSEAENGYSRFFSKLVSSLGARSLKFSIFCKKKHFERYTSSENFKRKMPALIQRHLIEFNILADCEESHARFIFSRKGGISYDKGFRSNIDQNQKYPVSYMSNSLLDQHIEHFVRKRDFINTEYTVTLKGNEFK